MSIRNDLLEEILIATGGSSSVTTDASLDGDGTALSPLSVESDSYTFVSLAERDSFFNSTGKSELLKTGLMVGVNTGSSTLAQFEWTGTNSPVSYDNTMWEIASIQSGTGSFLLEDAWSISSAGVSIGANDMSKNRNYRLNGSVIGQSENPVMIKERAPTTFVAQPVFTDPLTNPEYSLVVPSVAGEDGQTTSVVKIKVDPSSVLTDIDIVFKLDGTVFGVEKIDLFPLGGNDYNVIYNFPIDIEVGDTLDVSISSELGDVIWLGDSNIGVPYLEPTVILWDYKELAFSEDRLGYVLATWGANLQNIGRHPAINGTADGPEIPSLGISASAQVPADGTIDTLTYYNTTGDNTTVFKIIKNGAVAYTFTCDGFYGMETNIGVSVAAMDNIAIRYDAGTKPAAGFYSMYIK